IRRSQIQPNERGRRRAADSSSRRCPAPRLIGLPLGVTVPQIKGIQWRYCTRWNEEPAAKLGMSLLRLGICTADDWTGNAVDFVERGFKRVCQVNEIDVVQRVWQGDVQILDYMFEQRERERDEARAEMDGPAQTLFLAADFSGAASIRIGATLSFLEREHSCLPSAFFIALRHCLSKWMLVYDYDAASEHAEMGMFDREETELADSSYPKVAQSLPTCLRGRLKMNPRYAFSILRSMQANLRSGTACDLVCQLLEMWRHSAGYSHHWPYRLIRRIPGLDDYLEECDGIGPGCLLSWYEDDPISACFDEEVEYIGQNGPLAPCILRAIRLDGPAKELDQQVGRLFDYAAAMIRSLACADKIVETIREIYDEHVRQHRIESGLQAESSTPSLRDEQL
ncbi:MAG: hypothetical protein ACREQ5_06030, partial [Candidatus Dormibacteria bacterium]